LSAIGFRLPRLRITFMTRPACPILLSVLTVLAVFVQSAPAQPIDVPLVPRASAEQVGLTRAWYGQVPLDPARASIKHIRLQSGLLLAVTTDGMLHVFDAETGQLQWSFQVGSRVRDTLSATASATHVAVANISKVFVLDRATGDLVLERQFTGTPEKGPALSEHHVVTPLVIGSLETYSLVDKAEDQLGPQYLPSVGRLIGDPAVGAIGVAWTGDLNMIHGHQFAESGIDFSRPVAGKASSGPTIFLPNVYVGTEAGYLTAYDAEHGDEVWRFSTGSPIRQRPIALGTVVYALPEDGGLFAVRPETGEPMWYSAEPVQFVSASPQRVYTLDRFGRIAILDAKTGARVATLRLSNQVNALTNSHDDRLVLYTDSGMIQGLRETQLVEPHVYVRPQLPPKAKGAPGEAKPTPTTGPTDATPPATATPEPAPQAAAAQGE
jgi:outer membrane protein assembly factor BamB